MAFRIDFGSLLESFQRTEAALAQVRARVEGRIVSTEEILRLSHDLKSGIEQYQTLCDAIVLPVDWDNFVECIEAIEALLNANKVGLERERLAQLPELKEISPEFFDLYLGLLDQLERGEIEEQALAEPAALLSDFERNLAERKAVIKMDEIEKFLDQVAGGIESEAYQAFMERWFDLIENPGRSPRASELAQALVHSVRQS